MGRGRPVKSQIRQNLIELLYFIKEAYGYQLYKLYRELFTPVTNRVIYYHLRKGEQLGEFKIQKVVKEEGDFSWGREVEKIYYSLGPEASPLGDTRVRAYVEQKAKALEGARA
tara:strand:- start:92 stop:430 length:339 start_codon:yes stop_codon:yes gene_type:complete